ncbi:MAG: tRNA 2-thiouridine(34) synthase MnmA [Bryobacteraceae bacterium]
MTEQLTRKRVVVAMSGGVDSSTTAALLKAQGHDVIGISMQLWDRSKLPATEGRQFGTCCSLDDVYDARRIAEQIGIPFYVMNFEEEFERLVIKDFVDEYFRGRTPNPCIRCNQWIKFELLMKKAHELSADFLATGHYARREEDADGRFHLLKGVDKGKDQSYFLFTLTQEQLASVLFPLGGMTKPEVRRLAAGYGLRVAEKRESQEICFVPDNNYVRFLEEERVGASVPGNIVDSRGNILGNHDGTYRYTIGQRKGLGVAHPHPLYVLGVDAARNEVVVGEKAELACDRLMVSDVNWIEPEPPSTVEATCKIRYRHEGVACRVDPLPGARAEVHLLDPARAITPGQAAVFYQEEKVLGGGWIENFQG